MIGTYKLLDDSEYELFYAMIVDSGKKVKTLMAKCIKSETKAGTSFPISEKNLLTNIKANLWVKVD